MTQSNAQSTPTLEITSSRQFSDWLAEQKSSLAFTTYQVGKVFLSAYNQQVSYQYLNTILIVVWACGQRVHDFI